MLTKEHLTLVVIAEMAEAKRGYQSLKGYETGFQLESVAPIAQAFAPLTAEQISSLDLIDFLRAQAAKEELWDVVAKA